MLIKPWAMMAENHRKMSRVLFDEPSDLYINDLRTALIKFNDLESDIKQIADLNTNIQIEYLPPPSSSPKNGPKNDGSDQEEELEDQENQENDENNEEEVEE